MKDGDTVTVTAPNRLPSEFKEALRDARYEVCQKHNIPFQVREVEFADEDEAAQHILRNQMGRVNLTPDQREFILGRILLRAEARAESPVYTYHPAANCFPLLEGEEFDRLVADIQANGQENAITIINGTEILDGRNRYRACKQLGIVPKIHNWAGANKEAITFVISQNVSRRHLNESQRAVVAINLVDLDYD